MSVIFTFLTVLLGTGFVTYAVLLHGLVSYQIASQQAFYDGSTGAMLGVLDYLNGRHDRGELREFYKDNYVGYKLLGYGDGRASSPDGSIKVAGYGRSIYSGSNAAKKVIVSAAPNGSFADYLHLIGECRDPVRHNRIYFWTPDTVDGRAHFNDSLFISDPPNDRPVFLERVTTSSRYLPRFSHVRFLKGIGYRPPIYFPDEATELRAVAGWSTGTLGHDSLTQLALSGDLIYYRKCGRARVGGVEKIRCFPADLGSQFVARPPGGVAFIYGKAWVSAARGRVDRMDGELPEDSPSDGSFISTGFSGKLTIGSSDTMIIADNLIYERARPNYSIPATMDSCSDVLGLVSEKYVMVGRSAGDSVYVNAAIAALTGAFSVQDIYCTDSLYWDNERDCLKVWGSIAQKYHGLIHTHEPYYHLRGFVQKDYHYDQRLYYNPPPHFPPVQRGYDPIVEDIASGVDDKCGINADGTGILFP